MALDAASTSFTTWVDSEVAERTRFGQSKFEKLAQNQIAFDNRISNELSAHVGDDVRTHFRQAASSVDGMTTRTGGGASIAHNAAGHYATLTPGGTDCGVYTTDDVRTDRVGISFEARVKMSSFSTSVDPVVGLVIDPTDTSILSSPPTDLVWFERGTNTDTWKCRTRSSSTDRTTTDNQSGNYTDWDLLRIVMDGTDAKFYINDVLVATHSTSPPVSVLLHGLVAMEDTGNMQVDLFDWKATGNSLSP